MTATPTRFRDYREMPMPLLGTGTHREIEHREAGSALMMRAGEAAAQWVAAALDTRSANRSVLVCAGPGNNGGDALLCAALLHQQGVAVRAVMPIAPEHGDARAALERARKVGVPLSTALPEDFETYGLAVDGLFGIGLRRAIAQPFDVIVAALSKLDARRCPVLAIDVPSGLDADMGRPVGSGAVVRAAATLAMIALKPGLFTGLGRDYTGRVWLAPLGLVDGLPPASANQEENPSSGLVLNAPSLFLPALPRRRAAAHKGSFGSIAVVGGDTGTCGATLLSSRAALYAGAGRVHAVLLGGSAPAYDPPHPEIMIRSASDFDWDSADALSVGAGMGRSAAAHAALRRALDTGKPAVLDADALNLVASDTALATRVADAGERLVITPHPGEAARLLQTDTAAVEADRLAALAHLKRKLRCVVVLKGSGTLIGLPDRSTLVNPTGNAGLASGGTGDVLGGLIGAFLAQGVSPRQAAAAAVYWHGRAAELLAHRGIGPAGLSAGELAPAVRQLMNQALQARDGRDGDGPAVHLDGAGQAGDDHASDCRSGWPGASPREAPLY